MANHKSALKRIRRNEAVRLRNRYQHKTTRNAIKKLRGEEKKKDANSRTGEKNYTHSSFDGTISITLNTHETIGFDDNIKFAQEKFDAWKREASQGASDDFIRVASGAYRSRKGQLDKAKVMDLFTYKIKHPLWLEMLNHITEAIKVTKSKRYPHIKVANDEGKMETIDLNFSSL